MYADSLQCLRAKDGKIELLKIHRSVSLGYALSPGFFNIFNDGVSKRNKNEVGKNE